MFTTLRKNLLALIPLIFVTSIGLSEKNWIETPSSEKEGLLLKSEFLDLISAPEAAAQRFLTKLQAIPNLGWQHLFILELKVLDLTAYFWEMEKNVRVHYP